MTCKHYIISGRVQGVFYRASTRDAARELGLSGWVRNLPDGRVEAVACGSEEMLAKLEEWMSRGPRMAEVDNIEIDVVADKNYGEFEVR